LTVVRAEAARADRIQTPNPAGYSPWEVVAVARGLALMGQGNKLNTDKLRQSIATIKNTVESLKKIKKLNVWQAKLLANSEEKLKTKLADLEGRENDPEYRPKAWKKAKNDYGFGDYHKYINSPEWIFRKSEYYKTHRKECRTCGSDNRQIHLHHRTYDRVYREDDADLMPLCSECHSSLHYLQGKFSITVERATQLWVDNTNGVSKKKSIRKSLRSSDFEYFQFLCDVQLKRCAEPSELLRLALKKIENGGYKSRDYLIKDPESIKKSIEFTKRTGNSKSYDKKVDVLIKKLSTADKKKKKS
jgi:hypothetical protein